MAHKYPLGGFDSRTGEYPLFYTQTVMSYNQDNRPAQTQNEHTRRPQLTELLQTTQLCGVSLSVYGTPAEPLFKAKEVADILGLTNPSDLIQRVDEDERAKFNLGRQGETWLLTEQGLYEVLMQSRKPVARQFKAGVKALLKALRTGEQPAANSQQPTPNSQPSGTYLRRTARLMESVSNQMHELRRRFTELDEASQMLATNGQQLTANGQEPTPLAGIDPIIIRGRVWYPLQDLLKSASGYKCPSMSYYTKRYADRIMTYYRVNYCDEPLARYIVARAELQQRQEALTAPLFDNIAVR